MATASIPVIPGLIVKEQIARGGMATVYLAVQEGIDRPVAVKLLKPEIAQDHSIAQRFVQEGRIMASLHHPGIASVYGSGVYNGQSYLVMEYVPAGTLEPLLEQGVSPQRATEIIKAIASALGHAHSKHYLHRDIKPQNILLRSDGSPVLTDFGIAKDLDSDEALTWAGTHIGSLCYMSPESIEGRRGLDGRSDLFSLGVLFYRMLSGRLPFDGTSIYALYLQLTEQPIPQLPVETARFQPIVERLLAPKIADRFATAEQLIQALDRIEPKPSQKTANQVSVDQDDVSDAADSVHTHRKPGWSWVRLILVGSLAIAILAASLWTLVPFYDTWRYEKLREAITDLQTGSAEAARSHEKRAEEIKGNFTAMARKLKVLAAAFEKAERERRESLDTLQQQEREARAVIEAERERLEQSKRDLEETIVRGKASLKLLQSQRATLQTQSLGSQLQAQEAIERLRAAQEQVRTEIQSENARLKNATIEIEEQLASENASLEALRQERLVIQQRIEELDRRDGVRLVELREEQSTLQQTIVTAKERFAQMRADFGEQIETEQKKRTVRQLELQRVQNSHRVLEQQRESQLELMRKVQALLDKDIRVTRQQATEEKSTEVELAAIRRDLAGVTQRLLAVIDRQTEYKERMEEIANLQRAVEEHLENDRLTSPSGDNAYAICLQLVRMDTLAADQCVVSIADRFEERAEEAIAEYDVSRALSEVENGLSLVSDHERLHTLSGLVALLIEAEQLRVAGRVTRPQGDSAFDTYMQVLRMDPDNSVARQGIVQILQIHAESLQRQSLSVNERREELGRILALLEQNLQGGPWHVALSKQRDELRQNLNTLEQEQRVIEALLEEATDLSERGDWQSACVQFANALARDPYRKALPAAALAQCPLLDRTIREKAQGLMERVRGLPNIEEENFEQAVFLLGQVLELVSGHRQACDVIRSLAEYHLSGAASSVADDIEKTIEHLRKGSRLSASDPRFRGMLLQIRESAAPTFVGEVIEDAYNKQTALRVFDAWELYQLVLVLDPSNSRVMQEISKILRYSLNIPHRRYIFLAEEIVQALLRMGVPYSEMEEELLIIKNFYDRQPQPNEQVQWRLERLLDFMESKGQSAAHSATCAVM